MTSSPEGIRHRNLEKKSDDLDDEIRRGQNNNAGEEKAGVAFHGAVLCLIFFQEFVPP